MKLNLGTLQVAHNRLRLQIEAMEIALMTHYIAPCSFGQYLQQCKVEEHKRQIRNADYARCFDKYFQDLCLSTFHVFL